jgi:hypothetical protein
LEASLSVDPLSSSVAGRIRAEQARVGVPITEAAAQIDARRQRGPTHRRVMEGGALPSTNHRIRARAAADLKTQMEKGWLAAVGKSAVATHVGGGRSRARLPFTDGPL